MLFLNALIESSLLGFGLFTLLTSWVRLKDVKRKELLVKVTGSAVFIVCVAAIAYLVIWIANLYASFQAEEEHYTLLTRLTEPYWFAYLLYLICYGIASQLLWIRKIRKSTAARILVALSLLFAIHFEKIIIMVTSLHRDYVPSSWTMLPGYTLLYDWLASLLVFGVILAVVHLARVNLSKAGAGA